MGDLSVWVRSWPLLSGGIMHGIPPYQPVGFDLVPRNRPCALGTSDEEKPYHHDKANYRPEDKPESANPRLVHITILVAPATSPLVGGLKGGEKFGRHPAPGAHFQGLCASPLTDLGG